MDKNKEENAIQEKSCGCVIMENNKVLLIQHRIGHWGFPKGHVEAGETEKEKNRGLGLVRQTNLKI